MKKTYKVFRVPSYFGDVFGQHSGIEPLRLTNGTWLEFSLEEEATSWLDSLETEGMFIVLPVYTKD